MLIQPRLFRAYIPIRPVVVMPRESLREQRAEARARSLSRKLRQKLFLDLQFPLFWNGEDDDAAENRESVDEVSQLVEPEVCAIGPEVEEPVAWANEEIVKLAAGVIEESLRALSAKNNPIEKQEILDWVFASDIVETITIPTGNGPRKRVLYASEVPGEFAFWCNLAGHDPDRYRDYIRSRVPEVSQRYVSHARQAEPCLSEVRYRAPLF